MKETEMDILHMQEGPGINYIRAFHEKFGGEMQEDAYVVDHALARIRLNVYSVEPGMEILLARSWSDKALYMEREPDGDLNAVHINLLMEGTFNQAFQEKEVTMEAGSPKGAFVYNGMFPIAILHPARQQYQSVSIKIRRETVELFLPEALDMFSTLFGDPEGVAYHAPIPAEMEKLCREMFHFRDAEFGTRAMVISRGIETLATLFSTIRKMQRNNALNGLHMDDFERLQRIKEYILKHIDEKVSLERLSSEFGISASKLKRDFRSLYDNSVYQFYTHARMDEAYRRLKSGKYSVMEVGYDLGYQNLSKFSQMFRKIKGLSPSEVI